jgi:hypothetical protein
VTAAAISSSRSTPASGICIFFDGVLAKESIVGRSDDSAWTDRVDANSAADLNDIFYFGQVVTHGGFAAAGPALRITKSKLS